MELENKVQEVIKNLNVDLNDLNNYDINLLTNQTNLTNATKITCFVPVNRLTSKTVNNLI